MIHFRSTKFDGPARERPRCLGAAIHTALHLIRKLGNVEEQMQDGLPNQQDMDRRRRTAAVGRLLVITTGSTTKAGFFSFLQDGRPFVASTCFYQAFQSWPQQWWAHAHLQDRREPPDTLCDPQGLNMQSTCSKLRMPGFVSLLLAHRHALTLLRL